MTSTTAREAAVQRDGVEKLYGLHADELMRFATSLVGPTDAADIVSVAFLGAMSSGALDTATNPRAYLYRCVLNAAHSTARSGDRRRRREHVDAGRRPVASPAPEADPEVWEALRGLSEQQRATLFLTYWLDLTPGAIAELLDISTGSVKQHLARGRATLRTSLGAQR